MLRNRVFGSIFWFFVFLRRGFLRLFLINRSRILRSKPALDNFSVIRNLGLKRSKPFVFQVCQPLQDLNPSTVIVKHAILNLGPGRTLFPFVTKVIKSEMFFTLQL